MANLPDYLLRGITFPYLLPPDQWTTQAPLFAAGTWIALVPTSTNVQTTEGLKVVHSKAYAPVKSDQAGTIYHLPTNAPVSVEFDTPEMSAAMVEAAFGLSTADATARTIGQAGKLLPVPGAHLERFINLVLVTMAPTYADGMGATEPYVMIEAIPKLQIIGQPEFAHTREGYLKLHIKAESLPLLNSVYGLVHSRLWLCDTTPNAGTYPTIDLTTLTTPGAAIITGMFAT